MWELHNALFRQLVFSLKTEQDRAFSNSKVFCEDTALTLDCGWVMVEDCYLFDFFYHKKLPTTGQVVCFLPVSYSAAEHYKQEDMSAFNRPR